MPPTAHKLMAGAAFVALGSGLMVLIAWPLTPPPKPEPRPAEPRIARMTPIDRPAPAQTAAALSPARPAIAAPDPPKLAAPIVAVTDEPAPLPGEPPSLNEKDLLEPNGPTSSVRHHRGGDICARHGGHRVEFRRGRWVGWRCVYARRH